jgi:hypothetical protein
MADIVIGKIGRSPKQVEVTKTDTASRPSASHFLLKLRKALHTSILRPPR